MLDLVRQDVLLDPSAEAYPMGKRGARRRRSPWGIEAKWARRMTNRKHRRAGRDLLEDAPPQKSTQGWITY